ncbi:MAG: V-type ATP synthase subunit A, partial [Candidatus Krumholzibacteria bacterium]|nr:V-type ATP synthase subunit A [Candidatus Krumholzibacteria bacterium]
FPAIGWLSSYSLYHDNLREYFRSEVDEEWEDVRTTAMTLLQKEAELKELVRLVGVDSLSSSDRIVLETSKHIREDFLHQSAFDPDDAYTRLKKQFLMLKMIIELHRACERAVEKKAPLRKLLELPVRDRITRMRYIKEDDFAEFDSILGDITAQIADSMTENRIGEAE